jgi:hydrolase
VGAPQLVLLHGITSSAAANWPSIAHWSQRSWRVIALDARGHGLSPRWQPQQLLRAGQQLVDDVVEVLEYLQPTPAPAQNAAPTAGASEPTPAAGLKPILIGHSMGAATAAVVAAQRPDLVSALVLEDPARYGTRSHSELLRRGQARANHVNRTLADLPASLVALLENAGTPSQPSAQEALPSLWASQQLDQSLLGTGVVAPEVEFTQLMESISLPTLLLTGDRRGEARVGAQLLAQLMEQNPHICGQVMPGAGHQVRRANPQAYYDVVDAFLQTQVPANAAS